MLMLGYPSAKLTVFVAGDPVVIERCSLSTVDGYCQEVITLGNEYAKATTLTIVTIVLLDLMVKLYALGEKSNLDLQLMSQLLEMISGYLRLKEYANRIRTRDFDNVGFDLLSAFKDVQLILQNSSDVRVPLYMLTLSGISFEAIVNDLEKKRLD
jgi:3-hydroxyisobutyrate dehydrogenase-like beta-hydroxyacid dehydrogenase